MLILKRSLDWSCSATAAAFMLMQATDLRYGGAAKVFTEAMLQMP
jgi:hypothetical protein